MLLEIIRNIHTAYFKSKDKILADKLKELTEEIYTESHPVQVCVDFSKFTLENDLYLRAGIISETESPSSKLKTMFSAIYCLHTIKNPVDLTEQELRLVKAAAHRSYVVAANIVTAEELKELLTKTVDEINDIYTEKVKMHEDAWERFLESDVDTEELAKKMLS